VKVIASQNNFTKSVNVRRSANKSFRQMFLFEEGRTNVVEVHWERPLIEKSIRAEITFNSRKNGT